MMRRILGLGTGVLGTVGFISALLIGSGCGKPSDPVGPGEGMIPVEGRVAFGNQCPYGTFSEPNPVRVGLWDCPIGLGTMELTEPPPTLVFQADCKKKLLTIRSTDRKLDSLWEVMPDGSFSITLDAGGAARFRTDGSGNTNCVTYLSADVHGRLNCLDRDRVNIDVNVVWWPGRGTPPGSEPSTASATACQLPSSCYLHATAQIPQCQ